MREIKFRAWDTIGQQMIEDIWIDIENNWMVMADNDSLMCYGKMKAKEVILMQYTGLKDKNGTEIYHCDIVKDKNGFKWEIMWGSAQFYLLSIEIDLLPDKYKFPGYCEIIGNIHENKELLNITKKG